MPDDSAFSSPNDALETRSTEDRGLSAIARRWSLRFRIFLFFALIAGGALAVNVIAIVLAVGRLGPEASSTLTLTFGLAGLVVAGITLYVWRLFDEHVALAINRLSGALRAAAHIGAAETADEIAARARYLGSLAPAVAEAAAAFAEMHRATEKKVADAASDAERQKAQLAALLRDLDHGVVIATLEHRTLFFNRRAVDVLHATGEIGLGRDLLRIIEPEPVQAALKTVLDRLAAREVAAHPDGASAPLQACTSDGTCELNGRLSLVLDGDGASAIGYLIRFEDDGEASAAARPAAPDRPEFYDFDLFHRPVVGPSDDTELRALTYVVFDTETTGLEPSRGDEIVSIGAVRIMYGRLLSGETFDQLVHPGRTIPQSAIAIHGVTNEAVKDAPPIGPALSRFHDFAEGSVLVAHNAAFDMRFLSLRQDRAEVRFDHPVLDTVLLAAHLFGPQEALSLDALCQRFDVRLDAVDRHTALGDALATARLFLRLIDVLDGAGIRTLGQAREASEQMVAIRRKQSAY